MGLLDLIREVPVLLARRTKRAGHPFELLKIERSMIERSESIEVFDRGNRLVKSTPIVLVVGYAHIPALHASS